MFRYDRPQAGRYRQFWQFDIEAIGDPGPAIDAEIIELGIRFYRDAGLTEVEVLLNSIGDPACRPGYLAVLTDYYREPSSRPAATRAGPPGAQRPAPAGLQGPGDGRRSTPAPRRSPTTCARRAPSTSPPSGRISTRSTCRIASNRPSSAGSTTTRGRPSSSTCPAATASSRPSAAAAATTGSWSCSAAGRRPASGSASGSIASSWPSPSAARRNRPWPPAAVVVGADPAATVERLRVATDLRAAGLAARADLSHRRLGKQLEAAAKEQAHFAVIVGDELAAGDVQLRDLPAGTQKVVPVADLAQEITRAHARPQARGPGGLTMADDRGPTLDDATLTDHERFNRADWNAYSDEYQAKHGADLAAQDGYAWGTWQIPETELQVLGDVAWQGHPRVRVRCGAVVHRPRAAWRAHGRAGPVRPPARARPTADGRGGRGLPAHPRQRRVRAAAGRQLRHRLLRSRRDDVRRSVPDRAGSGAAPATRRTVRVQPRLDDREPVLGARRRAPDRPARLRLLRPPRDPGRRRDHVQPRLRRVDPAVPRQRPPGGGPHRAATGGGCRRAPIATPSRKAWSRRWPAESIWRLRKGTIA